MTVLNTFVAIYCMSVSFTRIWASWEQGVYVYHSSNHLAWCLARGRCWAVFVELANECMFDKRVWGICEELKEVQQGWCLIPRRRVVRDKAGLLDWSYLLFYPFLLFSTKFNFTLICLLDQIFNNIHYSTNYICKHLLKHHCKVRYRFCFYLQPFKIFLFIFLFVFKSVFGFIFLYGSKKFTWFLFSALQPFLHLCK